MSDNIKTSEQQLQGLAVSKSERFINVIAKSYSDVNRGIAITEKEKALIGSYFEGIGNMLSASNREWTQVQMPKLAPKLALFAKLGMDCSIPNMLSFIPFNTKMQTPDGKTICDIVFVPGKEAERLKAYKFSTHKIEFDAVEIVYSNDKFAMKKGSGRTGDTYEFDIGPTDDRGEIVGAFGFIGFEDARRDKVMFMTEKEILRYKPAHADANFWGKWKEKMYVKTVAKQLFKQYVTIDPDKVRDYSKAIETLETEEMNLASRLAKEEIKENANKGEVIDVDYSDYTVDETTGEVIEEQPLAIEQEKEVTQAGFDD